MTCDTSGGATRAHAVTIAGRLYGYGATRGGAIADFRRQIAGGSTSMQRRMIRLYMAETLTDEQASEVAECIAAPAIAWL